MMDIDLIKKRLISAIDNYLQYSNAIKYLGCDKYSIKDAYIVNLNTMQCKCEDTYIVLRVYVRWRLEAQNLTIPQK